MVGALGLYADEAYLLHKTSCQWIQTDVLVRKLERLFCWKQHELLGLPDSARSRNHLFLLLQRLGPNSTKDSGTVFLLRCAFVLPIGVVVVRSVLLLLSRMVGYARTWQIPLHSLSQCGTPLPRHTHWIICKPFSLPRLLVLVMNQFTVRFVERPFLLSL